MHGSELFFDTSYIFRFYIEDHGYEAVRKLAEQTQCIVAAWHAQAEVVTALHRAYRERRLEQRTFGAAVDQFMFDCSNGLFRWLPLDGAVQQRLMNVLRKAPASAYLRGADALHLACAAEAGFDDVYSHDRHFLASCALFGLRGLNVIAER
jgi:predicted nucleic acid-binding protein